LRQAETKRAGSGSRLTGDVKKRPDKSHAEIIELSRLPTTNGRLPRYLFFGGKGGVGKTTAAAATALYLFDHSATPERILLFSTDPAHSLSDSLKIKAGDRPVEVARRAGVSLAAREMDAGAALRKFKEKHGQTLALIAERGTLLDEEDITELMDLSLPGLDEVMALFELSESDRAGAFTRVVVDTAPSGHTAQLLRLPQVFGHYLGALDRMADKHRYMVAQLLRTRRGHSDEVDLFLRDLAERIERVRAMLYDPALSAFTLVTIPEAMAVEETARYFDLLRSQGVPVRDLIVNRVEQSRDGCAYCRARVLLQKPYLKRITKEFPQLEIHKAPLVSKEVRGLASLRGFSRIIWDLKPVAKTPKRKDAAAAGRVSTASPRTSFTSASLEISRKRLLIFGGKGGVGKTTTAAATALALSKSDASSRVLIFSTDPAHSLSDSFDEPIGEMKRGIAGQKNLDGMEIDPAARFERWKQRYRQWIDELFDSLTAGSQWKIQFDREAMREAVSLAPPGIDEIAALGAISDLLEERDYSTIALDTAPTGHLLRFLELPSLALSWVHTFMKLLLKYKGTPNWGEVAHELIALSKNIKRVAALMTDRKQCEFVCVATAERMSFEETVRLFEGLKRLGVPARRVLINNLIPDHAAAACEFCGARLRAEQRVLKLFRKEFRGEAELFIAPQQPSEIRGRKRLLGHIASWKPLRLSNQSRPRI
jgi:arsenite/tail-anchored protein-transporting ATPase